MTESIRLLIVEDSEDDALLLARHLEQHGLEIISERVETAEEMETALASEWDAVLCDHNLPGYDPYAALELLHEREIDIPFIVVSGRLNEEQLVDLMKAGAHDVIVKSRLARLAQALQRELKEAQNRHKKEQTEVLLKEAIEYVDHGFAVYDPADRLLLANRQYSQLYPQLAGLIAPGVSFEFLIREAVKRDVFVLDGRDVDEFVTEQIEQRKGASRPREIQLTDGRWLRATDRRTRFRHVVSVIDDETEQKNAIVEIERLAHQDPLTKLANRKQFSSALEAALIQAERSGRLVGILVVDLDRLKFVNDTYGHEAGDSIIVEAAERLSDCVRASDTVARLGGDEFAIVATNTESPDGIAVLARRIVQRMREPFMIKSKGIFTGASVGAATYPLDSTNAESLVRKADLALYRAKERGRSAYALYDAKIDQQVRARQSLEADLHNALRLGQMELHYQPRLDIRTLKFVAVEALMRWRHPQRGIISPLDFIPVAEQTRLILELGEWAVKEVARQAAEWRSNDLPPLTISMNVSPMELRQASWIDKVDGILKKAQLAPEFLELEISERGVQSSGPELTSKLMRLKALGVRRAIHNFGTGYSSLSHMRHLPANAIKVDRSFVGGVDKVWEDTVTCATITRLAHGLQMGVVAEGIERGSQLAAVAEQGCDQAQGFYLAPPMGPGELVRFLRDCNGTWSGKQITSAASGG